MRLKILKKKKMCYWMTYGKNEFFLPIILGDKCLILWDFNRYFQICVIKNGKINGKIDNIVCVILKKNRNLCYL